MDENAIISHEDMLCNHNAKIEKHLGHFVTIKNLKLNYTQVTYPHNSESDEKLSSQDKG